MQQPGRTGQAGWLCALALALIAVPVAIPVAIPGTATAQPTDELRYDSFNPYSFDDGFSLLQAREAAFFIQNHYNVLILDVRSKAAFERGHIADAQHIDEAEEDFSAEVARLDFSRPIIVYDHIGPPRGAVYHGLKAAGFRQIIFLRYGYRDWQQSDLPVETGPEETPFDISSRGLQRSN